MKYLISPSFISCMLLSFCFCSQAAWAQGNSTAKATKTRMGDCDYTVIAGLAEVTKVEKIVDKAESFLGYDEYEVLFKFIPKDGGQLLGTLRDQELEFLLNAKGEKIHVGPKYIKQYQVRQGTKYAMKFLQNPACEEKYRWADFGGLPNDFSEAGDKIDEIKNRRREEAFLAAEKLRTPQEDTLAKATEIEEKPSKEAELLKKQQEAEEKKRVEDSIAYHKRMFAFQEAEQKRMKSDSAYMADMEKKRLQEEEEELNGKIQTLEPKKKSSEDKNKEESKKEPKSGKSKDDKDDKEDKPEIEIEPIVIDTSILEVDLNEEQIRREAQAKIAKELAEKRAMEERIEAERLRKLEADRLRDSIAQSKILAKEQKKQEKEALKKAKEEEKRMQDSLARVAEQARIQAAMEEEAKRLKEEQLKQKIEAEVREEMLRQEAERQQQLAIEKARQEEERKLEAERQKLEAERLAEEKKRQEEEDKRGDCVYEDKVAGSILITSLSKVKEAAQSHLGYAEYEVKFKFTPSNIDDIPKKDRKVWETEYTFVIDPRGKNANPSAAYISTYNVLKNARFAGFAQVLKGGICNQVIVYSPQLPVDAAKVNIK